MKRTVVTGGCLVLHGKGIVRDKVLICSEGRIEAVMSADEFVRKPDDEIIDAGGCYVAPGFIDMHVHGGGGHDFMDGTVEAFLKVARAHAEHGTTALVPTTLTSSDEELFRSFDTFRKASACNADGAEMLGMHLEGPYFNPRQAGAQDPRYLTVPKPEHYNAVLKKGGDAIIRWSAAVELEGAEGLGHALREHGILASIGHTDAIYEEVAAAYEAGFTHMTHLYSAMSTISRRNAYRYAGALEAAYLIDDMTVEIIADGIHLPKPLLQFVYRFKGPERTALCTDAMRGAGMPDGEYRLGSLEDGQTVLVEDGVAKLMNRSAFAGSVATADRLVRTMVEVAEVPLEDAVTMMTSTPASILGIRNRKGALEPGMDADIVIFDKNINIIKTIKASNVIYSQN